MGEGDHALREHALGGSSGVGIDGAIVQRSASAMVSRAPALPGSGPWSGPRLWSGSGSTLAEELLRSIVRVEGQGGVPGWKVRVEGKGGVTVRAAHCRGRVHYSSSAHEAHGGDGLVRIRVRIRAGMKRM